MSRQLHFSSAKRSSAGLTFVEIMVALGVLGILLAVAAPSMRDLLERRRVIAASEELAGLLTYARAEMTALDRQLALHTEQDPSNKMSCAAVTTYGGFDAKCKCYNPIDNMCPSSPLKALRAFQLPKDYVEFSANATWTNPLVTNYILFSREHMEPGGGSDLYFEVVSLRSHYKLQVQMNPAGHVKVCSPNGDMSGYPRCA